MKQKPVQNWQAYMRMWERNQGNAFLRKRYPGRSSLVDALDHVIGSDGRFTETKKDGVGIAAWIRGWPEARPSRTYLELIERPEAWAESAFGPGRGDNWRLDMWVLLLLECVGHPVPRSELVDAVYRIKSPGEPEPGPPPEEVPAEDDPRKLYEFSLELRRLWNAVARLCPDQARAWMFGLKDNSNGCWVDLFRDIGIDIPQIAPVVGMAEDTLEEVWGELPWTDQEIATYFKITPQIIKPELVRSRRQDARNHLRRLLGKRIFDRQLG